MNVSCHYCSHFHSLSIDLNSFTNRHNNLHLPTMFLWTSSPYKPMFGIDLSWGVWTCLSFGTSLFSIWFNIAARPGWEEFWARLMFSMRRLFMNACLFKEERSFDCETWFNFFLSFLISDKSLPRGCVSLVCALYLSFPKTPWLKWDRSEVLWTWFKFLFCDLISCNNSWRSLCWF